MKLKNILTRALTLALAGVMSAGALVSCSGGMESFEGDLRERYDYDLTEYVKPGKYTGLKIRVGADNLSEAELAAQTMEYNVLYTTTVDGKEWVYLEDGAVAKEGHIAEVKYQGYLDGKPMGDLVHYKEEGLSMALGAENLIPGMDAHVIGMKIGEKKTVEFTVPDPCYTYPQYVGKTLTFDLELCAIRETELEPVGEGLYEYYGCTTKDDFEHQMISEIKRVRMDKLEDYVMTRAMDSILDSFEAKKYPEKELKEVKDSVRGADEARAKEKEQTLEQYVSETHGFATMDEYEKELDSYAKEVVFSEMVIYYIARKEQIALTNAAFDEKATELAQENSFSTPLEYMNYMAAQGYSEYAVRELIWGDMVKDFILKNTEQIKEG